MFGLWLKSLSLTLMELFSSILQKVKRKSYPNPKVTDFKFDFTFYMRRNLFRLKKGFIKKLKVRFSTPLRQSKEMINGVRQISPSLCYEYQARLVQQQVPDQDYNPIAAAPTSNVGSFPS